MGVLQLVFPQSTCYERMFLKILESCENQLAEEIESEATRLSDLTSRLLRKAELESEQVQARSEPMDLLQVVSSLVDRYAHRNVDRNFSFEQNCPGGVYVAGDEELLPLALGQLLENAVKYSCPHADILVSLTAEPDSVAVRVWNSGSSVPPEEREHIFERFHRGTNVQHMAPGSGLGLYIARKIVRAHRGTLAIDEAHRPSIAAPDERGTPRIQPRLASPLCASSSKANRRASSRARFRDSDFQTYRFLPSPDGAASIGLNL